MQNLRYKLFFIMSVLFTGVHLLGVNASDHYTYYTRQFLGNLGVRNPAAVSVRKIDRNDPLYHAAGYSDGTAIYLNEDTFGDHSEASNLFVCAHEAAHHALRHAYRQGSLAIEQEADETAARMLRRCGYRWIVEEKVDLLRQLVRQGQGAHTDGAHPTIQQEYEYLRRVLNGQNDNNHNVHNAEPKRNQNNAGAKRGNAGKAGQKRNTDKAGPKQPNGQKRNTDKVGRDKAVPERNQNLQQNPDKVKSPRTGVEELKDLLRSFNNLSREQKLVIAGIVGMSFMGWL